MGDSPLECGVSPLQEEGLGSPNSPLELCDRGEARGSTVCQLGPASPARAVPERELRKHRGIRPVYSHGRCGGLLGSNAGDVIRQDHGQARLAEPVLVAGAQAVGEGPLDKRS